MHHRAMTHDRTSPPRVTDIVADETEPPAGTMAVSDLIVAHPLLLLGWLGFAVPVADLPRPPRRDLILRRRKGER